MGKGIKRKVVELMGREIVLELYPNGVFTASDERGGRELTRGRASFAQIYWDPYEPGKSPGFNDIELDRLGNALSRMYYESPGWEKRVTIAYQEPEETTAERNQRAVSKLLDQDETCVEHKQWVKKQVAEADKRIDEYERDMIDRSGANAVACNVALELIFHWVHQLSPDHNGYDQAAREKLTLICRGAKQVPGLHEVDIAFVAEFERLVLLKLKKIVKHLNTWEDTDAEKDIEISEFGRSLDDE